MDIYLHIYSSVIISLLKPFTLSALIAIVAIIVLLMVSAIVSAAEASFFSLGPAEDEILRNSTSKSDQRILELIDKPKRLLATLLISLNFVNIAIVLLSSFITSELFDFSETPLLGFLIQVVVITFTILILGEVIPKIYATQNPLAVSRVLIFPVRLFQRAFYPLSSFLIFSTALIDKRIKTRGPNASVDQLSHALQLTSKNDLPTDDHKILSGIVRFGNIDVKQIMRPRMDVIAIDLKTPYKALLEKILQSGFSRVPVYRENLDKVVGVLYVKDLLPYLEAGDQFKWQSLLRASFFVPENKKIDDLLREFQHRKVHLAIVVDEYGGTSGIVTLEDVIEEIVGEINDEFDDDEIVYSKLDNDTFVFEGKILLNDFYRIVSIDGADFEEVKGDSDTLAGFIIEREGRIPQKGEQIDFNALKFYVESADARKVKRVKVIVNREYKVEEQ